jgi:hypothetical protein
MIDLNNGITYASLFKPDVETSTITGSAVDVTSYKGKLKVTQDVGTVSGTSPTLDGKIQDSEDGSTDWTDVSDATFTQVTASNDIQSIGVDTRAVRKYVRYVGTMAGSSPSYDIGVSFIGEKQYK